MKRKTLIDTNPHLKDSANRQRLIARSVKTSGGVEGIKASNKKTATKTILHRIPKKIYKTSKQTASTR